MTLLKHRGRRSMRYQHEKQPICIFHSLTPCPRPPARQCKYMRNNAVPTVQNPRQTATPAPRPRPRSYAHTRSLRPGTGPPSPRRAVVSSDSPRAKGTNAVRCSTSRTRPWPARPRGPRFMSCAQGEKRVAGCIAVRTPFFFPFFPLVSLCLQGRRWCCFAYPLRTSR